MDFIEALQNLGLEEKEARVYIALLKSNRSSAYAIADRAELKRPTTYVILDELIKKGLVYKVPRVKKQLFVAKSPKEVFALAEEKLSLAKEILPELLAISEGTKPKPRTLFFDGIRSIEQIYDTHSKRMQNKEIVGFYSHIKEAPKDLQELFLHIAKKFKKNKINVRGIAPNSPDLQIYRETDAIYDRKIKTVPLDKYSSNISIEIGEDYVLFFAHNELQVTLIENKDIAKTMKEIFELVWRKENNVFA